MTATSSFVIVSRDSFKNVRSPLSTQQDTFTSFLYFPQLGNDYFSSITLQNSSVHVAYNGIIGTPKDYPGALRRTVLYNCSGLFATYYDSASLTQPVSARVSESVRFIGGALSFINPSLSSNTDWSVRWAGFFRTNHSYVGNASASVRFQSASLEGVRLWIDGILMFDFFAAALATTVFATFSVKLKPDPLFEIVFEFRHSEGASNLNFDMNGFEYQFCHGYDLSGHNVQPNAGKAPGGMAIAFACCALSKGDLIATPAAIKMRPEGGDVILLSGPLKFGPRPETDDFLCVISSGNALLSSLSVQSRPVKAPTASGLKCILPPVYNMYTGINAQSRFFFSILRKGNNLVGTFDPSTVSLATPQVYGFRASDDSTVVTLTGIAFSSKEHRITMTANNMMQHSRQCRPLSSSRVVAYFESSRVTQSSGLKTLSVSSGDSQYLGSPGWFSEGAYWPGRVIIEKNTAPTTGSVFVDIRIVVDSYVSVGSVRIGSSPVTFFYVDDDAFVIRLRIPPNSGIRPLQFVSGYKSVSLSFSYEANQLSNINPESSTIHTGSVLIQMFGKSLGTVSSTPKFRLKFSSCEANIWQSDSSVSCRSSRSQIDSSVITSIGNLVSTSKNVTASQSISALSEMSLPQSGSLGIVLNGRGASLHAATPSVRVGHLSKITLQVHACTSCRQHLWISDSTVICKSGMGAGTALTAVVSNVLGVASMTRSWAYATGSISASFESPATRICCPLLPVALHTLGYRIAPWFARLHRAQEPP
jgi:hypothetical protein